MAKRSSTVEADRRSRGRLDAFRKKIGDRAFALESRPGLTFRVDWEGSEPTTRLGPSRIRLMARQGDAPSHADFAPAGYMTIGSVQAEMEDAPEPAGPFTRPTAPAKIKVARFENPLMEHLHPDED